MNTANANTARDEKQVPQLQSKGHVNHVQEIAVTVEEIDSADESATEKKASKKRRRSSASTSISSGAGAEPGPVRTKEKRPSAAAQLYAAEAANQFLRQRVSELVEENRELKTKIDHLHGILYEEWTRVKHEHTNSVKSHLQTLKTSNQEMKMFITEQTSGLMRKMQKLLPSGTNINHNLQQLTQNNISRASETRLEMEKVLEIATSEAAQLRKHKQDVEQQKQAIDRQDKELQSLLEELDKKQQVIRTQHNTLLQAMANAPQPISPSTSSPDSASPATNHKETSSTSHLRTPTDPKTKQTQSSSSSTK